MESSDRNREDKLSWSVLINDIVTSHSSRILMSMRAATTIQVTIYDDYSLLEGELTQETAPVGQEVVVQTTMKTKLMSAFVSCSVRSPTLVWYHNWTIKTS